jgi:hypothetical protein
MGGRNPETESNGAAGITTSANDVGGVQKEHSMYAGRKPTGRRSDGVSDRSGKR